MMNKKKLSALLLTGAMLMSMSTTAFAEKLPTVGIGTEAQGATVSITKDLEFVEGLAVPNATFSFTATSTIPDAPLATITDITYSNADSKGELKDGKYTISKNSEISFGEFKHAGLYEYTVQEIKGYEEGVIYSTTQYTLRVYVANKDDGSTYIKTITADDGNGKKEKVLFTNTYVKNNASLIIEKNTIGELADKTKSFEFTITFTKSATSNVTQFTGKIGETMVTCEAGKETSFKLHDKQQLVFENLPAGTRYVVKEKGVEGDGYTPRITVIENGITTVNGTEGNEKDDLSSLNNGNSNLVGENYNKVTFENTYNNTPNTGIIINNLPFILLIGVAILAFGTLAALKKRRTLER